MNTFERDRAFEAYDDYVSEFRDESGALLEMQQLKYDHSQRVATLARMIADLEKWETADVLLGEVAGLYHDIGRYSQYLEHRTFQDYLSINHGERGYEVLREGDYLDFLSAEEWEIVITTTRDHNAKLVTSNLPERQTRFLRLTRDSDKIDIYSVLTENIKNQIYKTHPEILHGVDPEGPANDALIDRVLNGETIGYGESKSLSDFLVVGIQWVINGFNFAASFQLLKDRQVVKQISEVIKPSPKVAKLLAVAEERVEARTREKSE